MYLLFSSGVWPERSENGMGSWREEGATVQYSDSHETEYVIFNRGVKPTAVTQGLCCLHTPDVFLGTVVFRNLPSALDVNRGLLLLFDSSGNGSILVSVSRNQ